MAGATVDAFVVDTVITLSGDVTGTIDLTAWVDPARRTAVRLDQVSDARLGVFRLRSDTTSQFLSFTPA